MDFEWNRGAVIGVGSFSTVSLAHVRRRNDDRRHLPPVLAVKSAPLAHSDLLRHEHSVLSDLQGCPHVVRCFGYEVAVDDGTGAESCNLFLEYVSGGSLRDVVRRSCGGFLGEPSVRHYTRSILRGLSFAHARGYAHCDIKPQNILIDSGRGGEAKIADFGLAIKLGDNAGAAAGMRGTPLYMAPESAARGEHAAASDVWSTGCLVAEIASGRPPWRHSGDRDGAWENLLFRIGFGEEVPEVPSELSEEGKDFLQRCFVKDPAKRWTAEMLLRHPFVAAEEEQINAASVQDLYDQCSWTGISPRSVIGLSPWVSPRSLFGSAEIEAPDSSALPTPVDRIKELAASQRPNWSDDGCWINVRDVPEANYSARRIKALQTKMNSNEDGRGRGDELMDFNNVESSGTVELVLPSFLRHF